ncbi:uncharacterized protein LOC144592470 [Rhinoraja longicauda]
MIQVCPLGCHWDQHLFGKDTQGRLKSGRAVVVGDSIVRGTDRRFCGSRRDLRMVCCLPGARVQHITDRLQKILVREGDQPEVVVHVGTNDVGRKRKEVLQREFRELGKALRSRTPKDA